MTDAETQAGRVSGFRYFVMEVTGLDVPSCVTGPMYEGRIGQLYAACDDETLAFQIHELLMKNSGAEPLQLMIYDSICERGMTPA